MSLFDKEKDEMLIKLVRGKPVIYDSSHPQHRNLIAKHTEWKEISAAMDIPIVDIQKRWKHFRDHYKKKKKLKSKKITWKYMSLLDFLSAPSKLPQLGDRRRLEEQRKALSQEPQTPELSDISILSEYEDREDLSGRSGTPLPETSFKFTSNIPESNNSIGPEDIQILGTPSTSSHDFIQKKRKPESERPLLFLKDIKERLRTLGDIRSQEKMLINETPLQDQNSSNRENLIQPLHKKSFDSDVSRDNSPIHKYFAVIAEIATTFPPHLVSDLKLRIHKSIYRIELECQARTTEGEGYDTEG